MSLLFLSENQIVKNLKIRKTIQGNYNMAIYLTEDSLMAYQVNGYPTVETHMHRHVLRKKLGDKLVKPTTGTTLEKGMLISSIPYSTFYFKNLGNNYTIGGVYPSPSTMLTSRPYKWRHKHCKVIAVMYNTTTQEVIQAEEADVVSE